MTAAIRLILRSVSRVDQSETDGPDVNVARRYLLVEAPEQVTSLNAYTAGPRKARGGEHETHSGRSGDFIAQWYAS